MQPGQGGQFQEFARWLAQQGIDMANLARADRNAQLAVANAFQQEQADRAYGQQQLENQYAAEDRPLERWMALRAPHEALVAARPPNPGFRRNYTQALVPNVPGGAPFVEWQPTDDFMSRFGPANSGTVVAGAPKNRFGLSSVNY